MKGYFQLQYTRRDTNILYTEYFNFFQYNQRNKAFQDCKDRAGKLKAYRYGYSGIYLCISMKIKEVTHEIPKERRKRNNI